MSPKRKGNHTPFSVRLSERDLFLLRKICDREHRTVADEIRHLVEKELAYLGMEEANNEPGIEYAAAAKL